MLGVIMLSVVMLSVIMLSVAMLNVVAPQRALGCQYPFYNLDALNGIQHDEIYHNKAKLNNK
jgi:hypothetical protein